MQVDEFEIVLRQITLLGKAQTKTEINTQIHNLLETIGNYACAGRVFIFEMIKAVGIFTNTYEWCAEGITPQIENLQTIAQSEMPYWYEKLKNRESIIIQDVEAVRDIMPQEYELLKAQNIHTEIAVPMIHKNSLIGFVGLDNPRIEDQATFVHLLEVVGLYIGNIWENIHMDELLRKEQGKVEEGRLELEKKQHFLEVLCRDFTCVYYLNLLRGRIEVLKLADDSNMVRIVNNTKGWEIEKYPVLKDGYIDRFVVRESAGYLREKLELEQLKEELKDKESVSYFYRSAPNTKGHRYFEAQVIRMDKAEQVQELMLGFRHVDEIVIQERKKQEKLEQALEEIRTSNDIISAISKIYYMIYRINLVKDHYVEITSESEVYRVTGKQGAATRKMQELCDRFVASEYHDRVAKFFDLSTVQKRLEKEDTIAMEYLSKDGNWHMARFIAKNRDISGRVTNILYVTRIVNDEKHREQNCILVAEEANRQNAAKSDFLSRMAHDIRTPLNAIRGFTEILKEQSNDTEKVQDGLEKIERSGQYLQQLIDDILDLEKIEKNQMKLKKSPCSMQDIFDSLRQIVDGAKGKKDLILHWKTDLIQGEPVMVDAMRLKQIIMNLVLNAIKYTPEGGNVWLEASEEELPKRSTIRLNVMVKDDGIGMTSEYMKQMYSKFTRAVDTRVNEVRGSGLGLAIVKQLVDMMNGTIDVKSEPEKGTTFWLVFELDHCSDKSLSYDEKESEDRDYESLCRGMHLLVAEDNELNYEMLKELLEMHGITCDRAENGDICVEKYKKEKTGTYDAILMDMQMPVMGGLQATEMIRCLESKDVHEKIIAVTANAFETDIQKCREAGMDAHLSKPIDLKKLFRLLA